MNLSKKAKFSSPIKYYFVQAYYSKYNIYLFRFYELQLLSSSSHKTCFYIVGDTLHVLCNLIKIISRVIRVDWLHNFLNNKIENGNEMEQKRLRLGDDQGHFISKYYKSL